MVGGKKYIRWVALFLFLLGALFGLRWLKHKTDFGLPVLTDSMEPTILVGNKILTNPWETPQIGDMLLFRCTSEAKCGNPRVTPTIHRWVSTDPDGCMRIIGDNTEIDWSNEICFYPSEINIEGVAHKIPEYFFKTYDFIFRF